MWFDETRQKVNHFENVKGQEKVTRGQNVKCHSFQPRNPRIALGTV